MVNPTLIKKPTSPLMVNEETKKLFQVIYADQHKESKDDDDTPRVKVSDMISKMSFYYEKIRNAVDYKEDHLLRKNAIERILKRRIVMKGYISLKELNCQDIALNLIIELIRASYLPNNIIPEEKIGEVAKVIERYIKLRNGAIITIKGLSENKKNEVYDRNEFSRWTIALAASDIEDRLSNNTINKMVVRDMFDVLKAKIKLPDDSAYQKDKDIQIFISIYRNFLKFDPDMLSFILFKYYNATWSSASDDDLKNICANIVPLKKAIEFQLNHPLAGQLNRVSSKYTMFFSVLVGIISKDPVGIYNILKNSPSDFQRDIKKVCEDRYKQASAKLWRSAIRSIIYIFLTKSVFVFLIEAPATLWFGQEIHPVFLAINVVFPAFLLFMVVLFTKLPGDDNTKKIADGINEIAFKNYNNLEPITLRQPRKRGIVQNLIFSVIYTITFFMSFGAVVWGLYLIGFNFISIIIFLFFLAFVSFFGIRIRKGAKEMVIVEPKETIVSFITDFFYIPIVAVGKWLSERFSNINVFVFILDFIIEAPFKIFVEIAEEWTKYVKERKDEIV